MPENTDANGDFQKLFENQSFSKFAASSVEQVKTEASFAIASNSVFRHFSMDDK